jgi:Lsr2
MEGVSKDMAQRTVVTLEDDIDGGPAEETITFALDGVSYEIDLNEDNAAALRDALAPYVGAGRRVGGRASGTRGAARAARSAAPAPARRTDTAAVREWAREQGHQVSDRGRIPTHILEAYEQAHS